VNVSNRTWTTLAVVLSAVALLSCGGGGGGGGGLSCPGGKSSGAGPISLCYRVQLTTGQQAAFEAAVARLNAVIAGSTLSTVNVNEKCDDGSLVTPTVNKSIAGLVILVNVKDMGASSGILAASGPCVIRGASKLPLVSVMEMNTNYLSRLSDANLRKTVLHEMTHALGFGTLWDQFTPSLLDATAHTYTGAAALAAAKADNAAPGTWTTVPVEDCVTLPPGATSCGGGTRDAHWRWATFDTELMTGWITNADQPLSATTLASLQDLGYTADLTQADPYTIPGAAARIPEAAAGGGFWLGDDARKVPPVEVPED
jgi:hypothetical protein